MGPACPHDPVARYPAPHGDDIADFERSLGPRHFDRLLAVGVRNCAVVGGLRGVGNSEVDLRFDPPRAGSHTGTYREPM